MYLDFLLISVGWCNTRMGVSPGWIQVDFKQTVDIYGLVVQKHSITNSYMNTLVISYSSDKETWTYITNEYGTERRVSGISEYSIFAHASVCQYF